jgi:hypothetical protein
MRTHTLLKTTAALAAGLLLFGCTSNGTGGGAVGGVTGSGGLPNDGTGPTNITSGGSPVSGHFICTQSASAYGDVTTAVGTNGLVGADLTALLNTLGGNTATTLLNSVINPNNVIDGNLATYATYSLTVGLFSSAIDSVDLDVILPSGDTVPAGQFAVFGISFPGGTVGISLLNKVEVATYLSGVLQESNTISQSALSLLGAGLSSPSDIWVGIQATKPYDTAVLSLTPGALSADVGNAMYAYEFCPGGNLVQ